VLQEASDKNEFIARHTRVAAMAELRCAIMRKLVRTAHYQTERNFSESLPVDTIVPFYTISLILGLIVFQWVETSPISMSYEKSTAEK